MPSKDEFTIFQDRKSFNIERMKKSKKLNLSNQKNRNPLQSINVNKQNIRENHKSKPQVPTSQLNTRQLLSKIKKDEVHRVEKIKKQVEINPTNLRFESLENNRGFLPRFNSIETKLNNEDIKDPIVKLFQLQLQKVVSWYKLNRYQYSVKEEQIKIDPIDSITPVAENETKNNSSNSLMESLLQSEENKSSNKQVRGKVYKLTKIQNISEFLTIVTVAPIEKESSEKQMGLIKIYDTKLTIGERICIESKIDNEPNHSSIKLSNGQEIDVYLKWKVVE
ncbi:uncharacterized protein KGF55_000570 [Candida pseudojiufengensis]|uniref:uncharacterized protein n=1 Tax=Candida pseudojiufengensis TaxID=497109 RepID=UPI0022246B8D|nr:uncharacterized protein KGF55_000570 [Candida pseudojiufengensis]KAI5966261.1 hypothetical protein KGF55_000570 [Candida pseudojiufengensis]